MPLAFDTINRGKIAFGFFNIESDMLLLERYFFFADYLCERVIELACESGDSLFEAKWKVFVIEDPEDVGDLIGAIHRIRFTGFIGETYRKYPFPENPGDFRQSPEGFETQGEFAQMIGKYASEKEIPFSFDPDAGEIAVGEFRFTPGSFRELIAYVEVGGMPRYRDGRRPGYVDGMRESIRSSRNLLFKGAEE